MSAGDCIGPDNVEEVLHRIDQMTLSELRLFWSGRWGAAPGLRSVGLLKHLIAWRIQVAIFGGLDPCGADPFRPGRGLQSARD